LKQRALSRTVMPNDANDFTLFDFEGDIFQRPYRLSQRTGSVSVSTQQTTCLAEGRQHRTRYDLAERLMGIAKLTDLEFFAQVYGTNRNITHDFTLSHICESFFHTTEVEQATDKQHYGYQRRDNDHRPWSSICAQQCPTEAFNNTHHRVDAIQGP